MQGHNIMKQTKKEKENPRQAIIILQRPLPLWQ
jgi:hypothetical protein